MSETPFSNDELQRCIQILETLLGDRKLLAELDHGERVRLVMAAGRLSRPERHEIMKLSKAHRKARARRDRESDKFLRAQTEIRKARETDVFLPPTRRQNPSEPTALSVLKKPRNCYVCHEEFRELHFFYDTMCVKCGDLNYDKRFQTASLAGTTSLVTGSRVKIGYQCALMLLRAGSSVIATTRFPQDAVDRFSRETDFAQWSNRLSVYGLDLRHSPSVETFSRHLNETFPGLDFLINNACQTVRRPPGFYSHMMSTETRDWDRISAEHRPVLEKYFSVRQKGIGLLKSSSLSQVPLLTGDGDTPWFPEGARDADLQQIDLRHMNSWRLTLGDVPTVELMEVHLVNAVAPFILCSKLKPLFLRRLDAQKHIVNVSAMEGKFSRHTKTDKHPHTNMAKAALNMMTLTSAPDYAKDRIYMNAVDTGWVTDEDPWVFATRKKTELDFQPPLDIVDGAARVCDPIFSGINSGAPVWGKFLKDYAPTEW